MTFSATITQSNSNQMVIATFKEIKQMMYSNNVVNKRNHPQPMNLLPPFNKYDIQEIKSVPS